MSIDSAKTIMIEIKHVGHPNNPYLYELFIDGSSVDGVSVGRTRDMGSNLLPCSITATDSDAIQRIIKYSITQFPPVDYISFQYLTEWVGLINHISITGLAEITDYEGKGFNVKLPEIYRRLRELFRKRE